MSFSFRRTRQLGLGGLLVLMLVVSAIAVSSLRDITRSMQHQVMVQ